MGERLFSLSLELLLAASSLCEFLQKERRSAGVTFPAQEKGIFRSPERAPFCAHKKGQKKRQGVKIQMGFMPCAAYGRHFGNIPHDFHPLDPITGDKPFNAIDDRRREGSSPVFRSTQIITRTCVSTSRRMRRGSAPGNMLRLSLCYSLSHRTSRRSVL